MSLPLKPHIQVLLFDLDGTLFHLAVDWPRVKQICTSQFLDSLGLSFAEAIDRPQDPMLQDMFAFLELEELKGFERGVTARGAKQAIRRLASVYKFAIVTRNSRRVAQRVAAELGMRDLLVVGRSDVARPKPHPGALHLAMSRLEVHASACAMVGDTTHDVLAAKAAGVACVVVKNDRNQFTPEGASAYVEHLSELLGPTRSSETL